MYVIIYFNKQNISNSKNKLIHKHYYYYISNDSVVQLINISSVFILPGLILGLRYELTHTFEGIYRNWTQYNFEKEENKNGSESASEETLYLKLGSASELQWNHTSFGLSIYRLILLIICVSLFVVYLYMFKWDESNIMNLIIFNCVLPIFLFSLGLSLVFKKYSKY